MLNYTKKLAQSKIVRNTAIVATGAAGAQAITFAFIPIITRLYGPEAFGLLGTFMAILAIATPIAALTYPIAIVLPKSDKDALGLAKLSVVIAFTMASLLAMILLITGDRLAALVSMESIAEFLLLVPVAMLFAAFQQILQQWLIRKKLFKITARVAVIQAFMLNSAKAGIGWLHPVGLVLILLSTASNALHAFLLWLGVRKQPAALAEMKEGKSASIKEVAKKHKDFPCFRAPQVAINALTQSLPVLVLASFFGPVAAGYFVLCKSVLSAPATLIGKSVGDVFYPRITEAYRNNEEISKLLLKAIVLLFVLTIVPFGLLILFGPSIFSLIFGLEWRVSGEFARWVSVWMLVSISARPIVSIIPVLGLQKFFLKYELCMTIIKGFSLYVGVYFESEPLLVMLYSVASAFFYIFLSVYVYFFSRNSKLKEVA